MMAHFIDSRTPTEGAASFTLFKGLEEKEDRDVKPWPEIALERNLFPVPISII